MVRFCILFLAAAYCCVPCCAQELPDAPLTPSPETAVAPTETDNLEATEPSPRFEEEAPIAETEHGEASTGDTSPKSDDWKPAFRITLQTTADGASIEKTRTIAVPTQKTSYEVLAEGDVTIRKPVTTTSYREARVVSVQQGTATLFCDDIDITMEKAGESVQYAFQCNSRLRVFMGASSIDADSGSLSDGKLQLINVKISNGTMTATAASATLDLPLHGLSTAEHNLPLSEHALLLGKPSVGAPVTSSPFPTPDPQFFSPSGIEPERENRLKRSSRRRVPFAPSEKASPTLDDVFSEQPGST